MRHRRSAIACQQLDIACDHLQVGRAGNPFINSAQVPGANSENAGFTPSYLDRLSEEELDALLRGMREGGIESETERRQATAVMEAASRRRSGYGAGIG